ncbi:unnamed protein product [Cladocopium goreaui]|uniref:Uncharacterized protein n=1 Tax=Cladocopium goreaui TaxID=2562237 RepID=A0A9P1CF62_9DINO|nr:unnamed protein product [Cladocopium goreaui]
MSFEGCGIWEVQHVQSRKAAIDRNAVRRCQFPLFGTASFGFGWPPRRLTPIYTATSCGHIQAELQDFSVASSDGAGLDGDAIKVGLEVSVLALSESKSLCRGDFVFKVQTCLVVSWWVPLGRIFKVELPESQGGSRVDVAKWRGRDTASVLEGIVRVQMNAKLSGETSGLLIPEFLGDSAIPILMELRFSVGINVYFMPYILPPWAPPTAPSFKKECGLNMMGVLVNQFVSAQAPGKESRLGPLVCRESFTGMVIPPVGESPPDGKMAFTAAQVAPTEVFAGEVAKDASLFLVIGISYFCCFVFAHVWIFGAPPESAKRAYAGCGSRLNSCYKSLKNENTLPWKDLTLLSTSGKASRPQPLGRGNGFLEDLWMDPKSTEHLLGISKDASQWTNITDAQRKDSVDTRDFLLQRPRRESNSSGGLSETESQAMLRAGGAGTSSVATRDADVSDAREVPRNLWFQDQDVLSLNSAPIYIIIYIYIH